MLTWNVPLYASVPAFPPTSVPGPFLPFFPTKPTELVTYLWEEHDMSGKLGRVKLLPRSVEIQMTMNHFKRNSTQRTQVEEN